MRVLVYAAGVYALCTGCAEAFAPQSAGPSGLPSTRLSAGKRTSGALKMGTDLDDPAAVMARVDAMMQGKSLHSVAASFEASYKAPSGASAADKKWEPYGGYNPKGNSRPAAPKEDSATIMARASQYASGSAPAAAPAGKKWEPYGGYSPKGSSRPAAPQANSADVMARVNQMLSSSPAAAPPAKKWNSPVGYVPAGRASADPLSNAPAKKWQVFF